MNGLFHRHHCTTPLPTLQGFRNFFPNALDFGGVVAYTNSTDNQRPQVNQMNDLSREWPMRRLIAIYLALLLVAAVFVATNYDELAYHYQLKWEGRPE